MDEINVVRKGSRTWMWVVGLIILAAIIWAVVAMSNNRNLRPTSELMRAPQAPAAFAQRPAKS